IAPQNPRQVPLLPTVSISCTDLLHATPAELTVAQIADRCEQAHIIASPRELCGDFFGKPLHACQVLGEEAAVDGDHFTNRSMFRRKVCSSKRRVVCLASKPRSEIARPIAAAISLTFADSALTPLTPSTKVSVWPPTGPVTTGVPAA